MPDHQFILIIGSQSLKLNQMGQIVKSSFLSFQSDQRIFSRFPRSTGGPRTNLRYPDSAEESIHLFLLLLQYFSEVLDRLPLASHLSVFRSQYIAINCLQLIAEFLQIAFKDHQAILAFHHL